MDKKALLIPFLIAPLLFSCGNKERKDPTPEEIPLNFTCLSDATLTVKFYCKDESSFAGYYLEYSTDNKTWQKVNTSKVEDKRLFIHSFSLKKDEVIYFRSDNYKFSDDFFLNFGSDSPNDTLGELSVGGNAMSLFSKTRFAKLTELPNDSCFMNLFFDNKSLVDASNLLLPAMKLTENCYYSMFDFCDHLVTPPKLPATTLAPECYCTMFNQCEALTSAPYLPATELVNGCYCRMFDGNGNLHITDELEDGCIKIFTCPIGKESCCEEMFTVPGYVKENKTYYYIPH